ncbi:MAG: restriction endonuclease subunit R, partial [Candidatus Electrothrix sp. ATG2]|nr:restriction endonuclease subunit R [Candidatus Electrothrix sp. ATG2]
EEGKKKLDQAREALHYLCEPVRQPRELEQFLQYFCGLGNERENLESTEQLRVALYKAIVTFLRAYAALAQDLAEAGYAAADIAALQQETALYTEVRAAIKQHAGEELDLKPYEADMRHLINTYIQADPAEYMGNLNSLSLTELIIETGIHDAVAQKLNQKGKLSKDAVAEGIINNLRKTVIREQLTDPRFYTEMSRLLEDLIRQYREGVVSYADFLSTVEEQAKKMGSKKTNAHPAKLNGKPGALVLFNNLDDIATTTFSCPQDPEEKADLALELDRVMLEEAPAGWKEDLNGPRGNQVLNALFPLLARDKEATRAVFEIIKQQSGY